jgi:hypothetical protein
MNRVIFKISTVTSLSITLFFILTFIIRNSYSYNSEGNYFDESSSIVYHEQSVVVYFLLSIVFSFFTFILGYYSFRK